jgi:hypothetical protein
MIGYRAMNKRFRLFVMLFFVMASTCVAAGNPDFSGSYTMKQSKSDAQKGPARTLQVVQTSESIEVTEVADGKQTVNVYPLNGAERPYTSQDGAAGTCTAKLKGKDLILESFVAARPQPGGPSATLHTKQRWELSSDLKVLTIHSDVDSSLLPGMQVIPSWSDVYVRN